MSGKRWELYVTMFQDVRDAFRDFLKENGIYYKCDASIFGWEFEVKASDAQFDCIDNYWCALPRLLSQIEDLDYINFEVA